MRIARALVRPLPIFTDSKPAIDSVNSNTVTSRVKHIAVPILYMHEQVKDNNIELKKIDTTLNLADSGTKPNPAPTFFRHFDHAIGVRFYPPEDSEHYKLPGFINSNIHHTQTKTMLRRPDLLSIPLLDYTS